MSSIWKLDRRKEWRCWRRRIAWLPWNFEMPFSQTRCQIGRQSGSRISWLMSAPSWKHPSAVYRTASVCPTRVYNNELMSSSSLLINTCPKREPTRHYQVKNVHLLWLGFVLFFLYRFFFVDSLSQLLSSHLRSLVSLSINLVRHWREKKNSTKKSSFYFTLNDVVFKDNSSARLDPH